MRAVMLVAAVLLLTVAPAQPRFEPRENFSAGVWMQLPPDARLDYLAGVVDGMAALAHVLGGDLRPTASGISYQEAVRVVDARLEGEPALQSLSTASVIADTLLGVHLTIVDPEGHPVTVRSTGRDRARESHLASGLQ